MISRKNTLINLNTLKEKLAKNETEYIKGQDFIYNTPIFWVDSEKDIYFYTLEDKLVFKNK